MNLEKVLVNGIDTGLCNSNSDPSKKPCGIIMDSGTSTMSAPYGEHFEKMDSILNSQGRPDNLDSWPKITFIIDSISYIMNPVDYVLFKGGVTYGNDYNSELDTLSSGFSPFESGDPDLDIWIAGDMFLSKMITIYDRDNDLVGIVDPDLQRIKDIQSKEVKSSFYI